MKEPYLEWARGGKLRYVEPENNRFKYLSPKEGQRFITLENVYDSIENQYRFAPWLQIDNHREHESNG